MRLYVVLVAIHRCRNCIHIYNQKYMRSLLNWTKLKWKREHWKKNDKHCVSNGMLIRGANFPSKAYIYTYKLGERKKNPMRLQLKCVNALLSSSSFFRCYRLFCFSISLSRALTLAINTCAHCVHRKFTFYSHCILRLCVQNNAWQIDACIQRTVHTYTWTYASKRARMSIDGKWNRQCRVV